MRVVAACVALLVVDRCLYGWPEVVVRNIFLRLPPDFAHDWGKPLMFGMLNLSQRLRGMCEKGVRRECS